MYKKLLIIAAALLLAGCGREEQPPREPLQSMETEPPHTVTSSTYTGTTVDFYYSSSSPSPSMGGGANGIDGADETGDTADISYSPADTVLAPEVPETVAPDTYDTAPGYDMETGDTGDGAELFTDTAVYER